MLLYRLNKEKLKVWLEYKLNKIAKQLIKQRNAMTRKYNQLQAKNFLTSNNNTTNDNNMNIDKIDNDENIIIDHTDKCCALQIITDYLNDEISEIIIKHLNMDINDIKTSKSSSAVKKRKSDWEQELDIESDTVAGVSLLNNTGSSSNNNNKNNNSSNKKKPTNKPTSAKALAQSQAVKNTKNIMSFFGGK